MAWRLHFFPAKLSSTKKHVVLVSNLDEGVTGKSVVSADM